MPVKFFLYTLPFTILFASCKQTNEDLINEGMGMAKRKKYKEAIKLYTKVINRNGRIQLAYFDRGLSFAALKDYSNALHDFNKVMALQRIGDFIFTENPNTPFASEAAQMQVPYDDALYRRAIVRYYMDSIEKSFYDFQKLVDEGYEQSNCFLWQGSMLIKEGNNSKACICFENAKQLAIKTEDSLQAIDMIRTHCENKQ